MSPQQQLKNIFTDYWHFLMLHAACKLDIFDVLAEEPQPKEALAARLQLHPESLEKLLLALLQFDYLLLENGLFGTTPKANLLTEKHPESLKNACLLWAQEHLDSWRNLDYTIRTGKPAFEHLFQMPFFDFLQKNPNKNENYQLAMRDYAREDYQHIAKICDFSRQQSIADIGGGIGTLLRYIALENPDKHCILFDLPEVLALIPTPEKQAFSLVPGSFFTPLPFRADALILSRVLHDWNDEKALQILENCRKALNPNGQIYIVEIMQEQVSARLLDLNMLLMCQSHERSFAGYEQLLAKAQLSIQKQIPLNNLQTILVCQSTIPS